MPTAELSRLIPLSAVHNFRDLGGYPTADGRRTRWRTIFRSDGLHRLTADDVGVMRSLGIRTVLDLRTPEELTERGRYPVGDHWVTFHHLPIIDVTWDPTAVSDDGESVAEFLLARYLEMLEMGEPRLAEAFQLLAMPEALPAVFHCAAGKDRTGLLAALLLSALGVPDEVVVADYALTGEAMERMRAWLEVHNPEWLEMMNAQPAAFLAADPAAMAGVLELIREAHGSTRAYLSTLGVSSVALAALEDSFLEPG